MSRGHCNHFVKRNILWFGIISLYHSSTFPSERHLSKKNKSQGLGLHITEEAYLAGHSKPTGSHRHTHTFRSSEKIALRDPTDPVCQENGGRKGVDEGTAYGGKMRCIDRQNFSCELLLKEVICMLPQVQQSLCLLCLLLTACGNNYEI